MRKLLQAGLVVCVSAAFADNYPRQPGIDAQHYVFRVTLSDETSEVAGETTADLRFVTGGVTQVVLDLTSVKDGKGMTVSDVISDGGPLKFAHADDRLTITLPAPPKAGDRRQFTVKYHGVAGSGLHIANNKFGERTFFSWNWPTLARQWLPTIDHPSDKATSEFLVTAPARYQVVANGVLVEVLDLGDGRRMTHWKQSEPIATWLNNFGVARFSSRHFGAVAGVPCKPGSSPRIATTASSLSRSRRAARWNSSPPHIGPFPYAGETWPTSRFRRWAAAWSTPARSSTARNR